MTGVYISGGVAVVEVCYEETAGLVRTAECKAHSALARKTQSDCCDRSRRFRNTIPTEANSKTYLSTQPTAHIEEAKAKDSREPQRDERHRGEEGTLIDAPPLGEDGNKKDSDTLASRQRSKKAALQVTSL